MDFYLQPLALIHGDELDTARSQGLAGSLAGGDAGFTACRVIMRDAGKVTSSVEPYGRLKASDDTAITGALERIERPRRAWPGLDKHDLPLVMGIINVTPDSFSDGGLHAQTENAIAHGRRLIGHGADILDIGGESTRPGAAPVSEARERGRVIPVIEALQGAGAPISVDTRNAPVMRAAARAGASILNDVSALTHDEGSLAAAAELTLPVILMHAQGSPETMQDAPVYGHVLLEVYDYLRERIDACVAAGIEPWRLAADPGIGFGKTVAHNLELIDGLALFHGLGVKLCLGASRKSFIGGVTGENIAAGRVPGSIAAALAGAARGAQILRVHDVAETVQALQTFRAIRSHRNF